MPPINQPNPSDRNSRLRAQKDQEETLGKLVNNFGGLISESTKFQVEKDKHNAKDIITSNEDVTLLSAEAVVKEVEKSSLLSNKTAGEFDTKINKKVPRFARDMLLSMGESRIKNFQGIRDLFVNLTSIFPNKAARLRSRKVQVAQLEEFKRDADKLNQQKLQVHWLEEISQSNQVLATNNKNILGQINQSIQRLIDIESSTIGGLKDEEAERKDTKEDRKEVKKDRGFLRKFFKSQTKTTEEKRESQRNLSSKLGLTSLGSFTDQINKAKKGAKIENAINIPLFGAIGTISALAISLLFDTIVKGLTNAFFDNQDDIDRFMKTGTAIPGMSAGKVLAVGKGAAAGAAIGAWVGRGIAGPAGIVGGLLIGAVVGGLFKALTSDEVGNTVKIDAGKMLSGAKDIAIFGGSVFAGFKIGAFAGTLFGPIGMVIGGILGAATGGLLAWFGSDSIKGTVSKATKKVLIAMGFLPDPANDTPEIRRIKGTLRTAEIVQTDASKFSPELSKQDRIKLADLVLGDTEKERKETLKFVENNKEQFTGSQLRLLNYLKLNRDSAARILLEEKRNTKKLIQKENALGGINDNTNVFLRSEYGRPFSSRFSNPNQLSVKEALIFKSLEQQQKENLALHERNMQRLIQTFPDMQSPTIYSAPSLRDQVAAFVRNQKDKETQVD